MDRLLCALRALGAGTKPTIDAYRRREVFILQLILRGINDLAGMFDRKHHVNVPPRARAAMFGEVKIGRVKALCDIPRFINSQKEKWDSLRAIAL